jgi:hypothetical protein
VNTLIKNNIPVEDLSIKTKLELEEDMVRINQDMDLILQNNIGGIDDTITANALARKQDELARVQSEIDSIDSRVVSLKESAMK